MIYNIILKFKSKIRVKKRREEEKMIIKEEIKAIEFTNSEIERMRESLLHKRDYLYSLPALNFKKTGIESLDELIKYIKESISKDIDEINYICSKLR